MSNPQVELHVTINVAETATQGVITLELDAVNAPKCTTNFLAYVGEPIQLKRQSVGIWVLLFLALTTVVFYLLKKEYWKDVH